MFFYEARTFGGGNGDGVLQRLRLRVTYQHCLKLIGRQQGPLLYTTTLLPGYPAVMASLAFPARQSLPAPPAGTPRSNPDSATARRSR